MFGINLVDPYNNMTIEWLGGASVTLVLSLFTRLFVAIGWYKLFDKAGKNGLLAFIPIVGEYHAFRMVWDDFSLAAIFGSTSFIAWVASLGVANDLITACAWVNLILWWLMCLILASFCLKTSLLWGFVYAALPWLGAVLLGWSPMFEYHGPWSSDPDADIHLDKQAAKKKRKKEARQAKRAK